MKFSSNNFYHVFNRGNNSQPIFLQEKNYDFFLSKIKTEIGKICRIVAYCLMPNHFHLMLFTEDNLTGLDCKIKPGFQVLERKLGTLQSSYTRAINNQERKTGSLFQAKVKVEQMDLQHATTCFHYIHQNPIKANLANNFLDWKYSSYHEYYRNQPGICHKRIVYSMLDIPEDPYLFEKLSNEVVVDDLVFQKLLSD